jgi:succinate dehydrogenase/fumarate reductase flavoprotein subunit
MGRNRMGFDRPVDKVVETDLLVIGGGMGGCPVSAKAREHGLTVTMMEKAKPERSGSGSVGLDHHGGPFPREGLTVLDLVERDVKMFERVGMPLPDVNIRHQVIANAFWAMEEMEKLGASMMWDDGKPNFVPSAYGGPRVGLRVHWRNVKPKLAAASRKRGVDILERTVAIDLLTNGDRVVGATGVNIRTGQFIVVKARATVIGTGSFNRNYEPETPQTWIHKHRYNFCPASICGDGLAIAFRAGAELVNMDQVAGMPTFRHRDDLSEPFGNFVQNDGVPMKCFTWNGKEISFPNYARYYDLEKKGLTPIYFSLEHLSDDYMKRVDVCTTEERFISLKLAEDRGFDRLTHRYESMPPHPMGLQHRISGIRSDEFSKTSLKGLYVIGDSMAGDGGGSGASTTGLLLGDTIHNDISEADEPVIDPDQVEAQKQIVLVPLSRKEGTMPLELESAVRYACGYYGGVLHAEGKLREGIKRLGTLKREFLPKLMAKNPHYLIGYLEVRNIIELSILEMQAIMERKETRGNFIRTDYPNRDPAMDGKIICQSLLDGRPVIEIKDQIGLKPEYKEAREKYGSED